MPSKTSNGFSTRSEEVYHKLKKEIVRGDLKPGSRLVRREVAKRFGISPIPVIEALHLLERDGLTESIPMYGSRVMVWDLEHLRSDEILREAIECQCARICTEYASGRNVVELKELATRLDHGSQNLENGETFDHTLHYQLHFRIAELTECPSLISEFNKVWQRRQMRFSLNIGGQKPIPEDWHRQLVAAIATKDPQQAENQMREHVRFGQDHDKEFIEAMKRDDFTLPDWLAD